MSHQSVAVAPPTAPALRHRWWVLVVLALAVSLIVIDGTIVNVALPTIIDDLHLSFTDAQWVGTLYALIFAALLLTSGWLGDTVGRRTTLLVGVVGFVTASVVAGMAAGPAPFLAARALQGVSAALVLPSTLSTVNATFRGRDRAIAFGIWGATISAMAAVGPLLGGWLTTHVDWRWIFWINVPIGAVILLGTALVVPNTRGDGTQRLDVGGFVLSALALGSLVFGLVMGQAYGWWTAKRDLAVAGLSVVPLALVAGVVGLVAFVAWERARARVGRSVLLDLTLFGYRSFRWGNVAAMIIALGEFGLLFVLPLYLQNALGYSSLKSGLVLAAMALGAFVAGAMARHVSAALSPARTAQIGVAMEALGLLVLALTVRPDTSVWVPVGVLVVYGAGLGLCSAQLTSVILHDVPAAQSGQGSAAQSTFRQLGSALGVAILSSALGQALQHRAPGSLAGLGLPPAQSGRLEQSLVDSIGGILQALRGNAVGMPAPLGGEVLARLAAVFTDATRTPMLIGAAALALAFVLTLKLPSVTVTDGSPEDVTGE